MGPPDEARATKTLEIYLQAWQMAEALAIGRAFGTRAWLLTGDNFKFFVLLVRDKGKKN
jgi:hypothetical protein